MPLHVFYLNKIYYSYFKNARIYLTHILWYMLLYCNIIWLYLFVINDNHNRFQPDKELAYQKVLWLFGIMEWILLYDRLFNEYNINNILSLCVYNL